MDRNNGKYICPSCSMIMQRGRNAPNCKYKNIDDHLMDVIDSEEKAYLLGWIASDGWLHPSGQVYIAVNTCDVGVLEILRDFVCPDLPIADDKQGTVKKLCICSTQWVKSIKKHLNLSFKTGKSYKKSYLIQMPAFAPSPCTSYSEGAFAPSPCTSYSEGAFAPSPAEGVDISDPLKWCFLRGYVEGDGCISIAKRSNCSAKGLRVSISSSSLAMRMMIVTFCRKFDICMHQNDVVLSGQYAARFLEKIYAGCNERFVLQRKYCIYKRLKTEMSRFWDRAAVAEGAYLTALENLKLHDIAVLASYFA